MIDRPDTSDDVLPRHGAPRDAVQRWRLVVARAGLAPDRQRAQLAEWEIALGACGLPVAGLEISPPKPRFAIAAPLAAGVPGEAELVDLWLTARLPRWRVREALQDRLPAGHRLVDLFDTWLGEPPLPGQVVASVYRAAAGPGVDSGALRAAASGMLAAGSLPRSRVKGDATVDYDLRPFVDDLEVTVDPDGRGLTIRMTLRHDPSKGVGRPEEVLGELGDRLGARLDPAPLVRERLVLAPERLTRRAAAP